MKSGSKKPAPSSAKPPAREPRAPRAPVARKDDGFLRDPALQAATLEHYADPVLYDHEYRRRRADVNYYRGLSAGRVAQVAAEATGTAGREVLELGCGSGRLLIPLVRDGLRVVGVDLSAPMLARCAERLARLPPAVRARGELLRGDFRRLLELPRLLDVARAPEQRRFPLIVSPFNAMMHLYTRADFEHFLGGVKALLAPGGVFAFDVQNPDLKWLTRDSEKRWARTRFKDPRTGRTYYYSTNHAYDAATQINWIRLFYDEESERPAVEPADGERDLTGGDGNGGGDLFRSDRFDEPRRVSDENRPSGPASPLPPPTSQRRGTPFDARRRRPKIIHLAQRQFFPQEMLALLEYSGFTVDAREGGFRGEPFDGDAESQVCRCSIRSPARR